MLPLPAAKARRAVPVGDADRAEESEVVQVQDRPRAGAAGRGQRAPAEHRMEVVGVDDVGPQAPHRRRHLVGLDPAAEQRPRAALVRARPTLERSSTSTA